MNSCQYCTRVINNKGSLVSHELCCKQNPNRVKRIKSPNAGVKKGCIPWNKGKKFDKITSLTLKEKIESGKYKTFCEYHARVLIKRYLIQTHGHKCMVCGLSEWLGVKIPLVCDHIDGNAENHELDNTRIICNNCDSITNTFKGKNRGKGRKNRYSKNGNLAERPNASDY
jgi:hypothetical protein